MRKAARENSPEAIGAVAKQLEGMFLNLMLSSMREANQAFSEGNMLSSKDVRFYEQMLDQQLSVTLSNSKGMGLSDAIAKQLSGITSRRYDPTTETNKPAADSKHSDDTSANKYALERYRVLAVPANGAAPENAHKAEIQDKLPGKITNQKAMQETSTDFAPISPKDFVDKVLPYAKAAAKKLGIPTESIVAQAALETGWGKHLIKHENGQHAFNFFGIKAGENWTGDKVEVMTFEYRNGIAAKEPAFFRSYPSAESAFSDYSRFLQQNPRYQTALESMRSTNDAKSWGDHLQAAGYATDPNYGKKIASIVERLQNDGQQQDAFIVSRK